MLLDIPSNYQVLFMQGGATTQFASLVYNLLNDGKKADYIVTGTWSEKAAKEAVRLGASVNIVSESGPDYTHLAPFKQFSPDASYIYYCDNETVHGVEMATDFVDLLPVDIPIVCDASSNLLSRKMNINRYGVVFGGAQKNMGPAGVTIVIVRDDLIRDKDAGAFVGPVMLDYKTHADSKSLYNTPPTFSIYVTGLVFKWALELGGIQALEKRNKEKSQLLYSTMSKYPAIYKACVQEKYQSRINIPFRILSDGVPSKELEAAFLKCSEKHGLIQLKGHRSVGGIRASLYNAMPIEGVQALVAYMESFAKQQ